MKGIKMAKSSKGAAFERTVCSQLSLWWTQDLNPPRDDVFWRTSQSGGRATERMKKNVTTAYSSGDVTFIDPIGQPFIDALMIELKRGYTSEIAILDFLDKSKGQPILAKWWDKAVKEKTEAGRKYPMLIFKRDRHKICMLLSMNLHFEMQDWFGPYLADRIRISTGGYDLMSVGLADWMKWCHPDFFYPTKLEEL
jgi:hypothetical protein